MEIDLTKSRWSDMNLEFEKLFQCITYSGSQSVGQAPQRGHGGGGIQMELWEIELILRRITVL